MDGRPASRSESLSLLRQTYFEGASGNTRDSAIARKEQNDDSRENGSNSTIAASRRRKNLRTNMHRRPQTVPCLKLSSTTDSHENSTLGLIPYHPHSFTPAASDSKVHKNFEQHPQSPSSALPPLLKSFAFNSVLPSCQLSELVSCFRHALCAKQEK